jgi:hypothetical protein
LYDVEMRAPHGFLQAFEAVETKAFDCEMLTHDSNATFSQCNYSAIVNVAADFILGGATQCLAA